MGLSQTSPVLMMDAQKKSSSSMLEVRTILERSISKVAHGSGGSSVASEKGPMS